ncbi:MAG TPA: SEC-C domain-containing protein [Candidatus Angelobacter sp.]|jgi:hypothetical protein
MADEKTLQKQHETDKQTDPGRRDDHDNDRRERPGEIIHPRPTHGEPAMRGQLVRNIEAMRDKFPQFTYQEILSNSGIVGTWRGTVQPIQTQQEVMFLLDDLYHNRPAYRVEDSIQHLPNCKEQHCHHAWLNEDLKLNRQFDLQLRYAGNEALPRCYVLAPQLKKLKHTWADGAICAFLDSKREWKRGVDTVADFLPHALIWLVKWMVFDATETWIGAEHDSSPLYHLKVVGKNELCWCGSGGLYRKCHRIQDQIDAGMVPPKRLLRPAAIQSLRWFHRH